MVARPWLLLPLLVAPLPGQRPAPVPVTAAEASAFTRTSTFAEVREFLAAIGELPRGGRLEVASFGTSYEGRELLRVRVTPDPGAATGSGDRVRVLVVANIHAGEVCGKEAVQLLLREIADGEHDDVLAGCDLWFVPVYNVDGNEKIAVTNRTNVNGPIGGVGVRQNAQGLDLNRDCVKVRSPEFRALLGLFAEVDPHVLFDLHTTNGSPHGYHLTYARSMSTNVDPGLDHYQRTRLLPGVRAAVAERHGFRVFDYGNFGRREPLTFTTFDHRPRYLSNYYGLRNRLSILSEAYAYEPFEVRTRATRAFVLEGLRAIAADRERIRELCAQADRRCVEGDESLRFGWDSTLAEGEEMDVLVGTWDSAPTEGRGRRRMRRSEVRVERMMVQTAFISRQHARLPDGGWALIDPSEETLDVLRAHGVVIRQLARPYTGEVERFVPRSADRTERSFQGVQTIELHGDWAVGDRTLPAGTWLVPARQRLARLAAQLLEPQSEDGLATWGYFETGTSFATGDQDEGSFPVLRVPDREGLELR